MAPRFDSGKPPPRAAETRPSDKEARWIGRSAPLPGATPPAGPVVVVVMDGVGIGRGDEGDAVALARTPILDDLRARFPWRTLRAHGTAVGLPDDSDMGNSEVGHNALGAGRVFDQGAKLVNRAIAEGSLFRGDGWNAVATNCLANGKPLHFIGLLSDGNVHSHIDHLFALLRRARAEAGVRELCVHALLDGRDVPETTALSYVDALEALLAELDAQRRRATTASPRAAAAWSRPWTATRPTGGSSSAAGTRTCSARRAPFRSARDAIETFRARGPRRSATSTCRPS